MTPPLGDDVHIRRPPGETGGSILVAGLLVLVLAGFPALVHGQPDTTDVPSADTIEAARDTTGPTLSNTPGSQTEPDPVRNPRSFADPVYGRPVIDSLPALTAHVGVERALAQAPGSFLYDLGAAGWPHGWSPYGLGPHRSRLWVDGQPYQDPLTGRARFDLLPPSFLTQPRTGTDPGGTATGVHTAWRDYDQTRPITELRYRRDTNGLNAIEVGHSQKHRLSLFGDPGFLQVSFGYGGRAADGVYDGSDLRTERRVWGRLRYQQNEWAVELNDLSSRHRIGAHSGVTPQSNAPFQSIYVLPRSEDRSQNAGARRRTFRNDLTARVRGPLLPSLSSPIDLSVTWSRNRFDFQPDAGLSDTTWTTRMNGGHARVQQSLALGSHALTLGAQGSLWSVSESNVAEIGGTRWSANVFGRDSLQLGATELIADAGWHATPDQQYPSASARLTRPLGPLRLTASAAATGQRVSWIERDGFSSFVQPLPDDPSAPLGRVLRGRVGVEYRSSPIAAEVEGFAHQIRTAVDLYADSEGQQLASTETVTARRTATPVRRVGATATLGWRTDASRGLYVRGRSSALTTLNAGASPLHTRLSRTLPSVFGRARIGARFVFFVDLITDLYVEARGWGPMHSRWFHPPTGRFAVPPASAPVPSRPGTSVGPSGTIDLHAEIKLRGATLFFAFENVQNSFAPAGPSASGWDQFQRQATLEPGTFVVPVYPLPARQFRFGVHWPIFD